MSVDVDVTEKLLNEYREFMKQELGLMKARASNFDVTPPDDVDLFHVKNVKIIQDGSSSASNGLTVIAIYGHHNLHQMAARRQKNIDNDFYATTSNLPALRASSMGEKCGVKRYLQSLGIRYDVTDDTQKIFDIGHAIERKMIGGGEIPVYLNEHGQILFDGRIPFNEYMEGYEFMTDKPIVRNRWYMVKPVTADADKTSWAAEDGWIFRPNIDDQEGFIYIIYDEKGRGGVLTGHHDFLLLKPSNWDAILAGKADKPVYNGSENEWIMCDVKTMNQKNFLKTCSMGIEKYKPEYDIQTMLYQMAFPKNMNVVDRAIFVFNKGPESDKIHEQSFFNKEYYIFPFSRPDREKLNKIINEAYKTFMVTSPIHIKEEDKDTKFCHWCDHKKDCMNITNLIKKADEPGSEIKKTDIDKRLLRPVVQGDLLDNLAKCLQLISFNKPKERINLREVYERRRQALALNAKKKKERHDDTPGYDHGR